MVKAVVNAKTEKRETRTPLSETPPPRPKWWNRENWETRVEAEPLLRFTSLNGIKDKRAPMAKTAETKPGEVSELILTTKLVKGTVKFFWSAGKDVIAENPGPQMNP